MEREGLFGFSGQIDQGLVDDVIRDMEQSAGSRDDFDEFRIKQEIESG